MAIAKLLDGFGPGSYGSWIAADLGLGNTAPMRIRCSLLRTTAASSVPLKLTRRVMD